MNTTTETQYLVALPNAELAHMFNRAATKGNADWANDIWNALYARVHRQQYPNDTWSVGDTREARLIDAVNYQIDYWR
jgi:hypothetical protein